MCRLSAALACAFVALTGLVHTGVTAGFDDRAQRNVEPLAEGHWSALTVAADPLITIALFAGSFVALRRRGELAAAWAWVGALALGLSIEVACKYWVDQIPFAAAERVFDVVSLAGSYPSGHAMRAVLLAGLGSVVLPRYRPVWIAYAVFVAVWVVVSGMHLVTDAAGGVLLGGALVAAVTCRWPAGRVRGAGVVD